MPVIVRIVVLKDKNIEIFWMAYTFWSKSISYLFIIHKSRVLLLGSYTPKTSNFTLLPSCQNRYHLHLCFCLTFFARVISSSIVNLLYLNPVYSKSAP
jgi:hypothetical protein